MPGDTVIAAFEGMDAAGMIERTSTSYAPWTTVESNDKYYARVKIIKTLCERLEQALDT